MFDWIRCEQYLARIQCRSSHPYPTQNAPGFKNPWQSLTIDNSPNLHKFYMMRGSSLVFHWIFIPFLQSELNAGCWTIPGNKQTAIKFSPMASLMIFITAATRAVWLSRLQGKIQGILNPSFIILIYILQIDSSRASSHWPCATRVCTFTGQSGVPTC